MFKSTYERLPPKMQKYRSFKNFSTENFERSLQSRLPYVGPGVFSELNSAIKVSLDENAPIKTRFLRGNNKPYMNQQVRKAIMKRSALKNKANRSKSEIDYKAYKKQRNFVVNLNKKSKKDFFTRVSNDSHKKSMWNLYKNVFPSKSGGSNEKITLDHNGHIINDEKTIANVFNIHFVNIVKSLDLPQWKPKSTIKLTDDRLNNILIKYASHPSVHFIKCNLRIPEKSFCFEYATENEVKNIIYSLDAKKSTSGFIPLWIIKDFQHILIRPLTECINICLSTGCFPDDLKLAEVIPVYKKDDNLDKSNYRPISILPSISKIYERVLFNRINGYFETIFSNALCGFRCNHSTQHALLRLLQNWHKTLDTSKMVGTVLMDLSKAFDSLPHDLLLAKLSAYGFTSKSILLIGSYLSNRKQRTKVGSEISLWLDVIIGVPQGSVLGPLLFNIFINDLMYIPQFSKICNFADDNTIYCSGSNIVHLNKTLLSEVELFIKWFENNQLVANPDKFQLMYLGYNLNNVDTLPEIKLSNVVIKPKNSVKLLGVILDNKLNFKEHIDNICKIASRNTNCLARIRNFIDVKHSRLLYNAYIKSAFGYAPMIWMFCQKTSYKKIESVQKRALRLVFSEPEKPFKEILETYNENTVHCMHLVLLATEIFKMFLMLNPSFMSDLFLHKEVCYNLQNSNLLKIPQANSSTYGTHSVFFQGCMFWNSLPDNLKNLKSIALFKKGLKSSDFRCYCHICK